MKKEMICIVCPMGCRMTAEQGEDGEIRVTGNTCKRGERHAKAEFTCPMRRLTTTVKIEGAALLVTSKR